MSDCSRREHRNTQADAIIERNRACEEDAELILREIFGFGPNLSTSFEVGALRSTAHFIDVIGVSDTISAANKAMRRIPHQHREAFRYFCGICWSTIREAE
jgi:hypothetical protein